jgi:hypothetical protein
MAYAIKWHSPALNGENLVATELDLGETIKTLVELFGATEFKTEIIQNLEYDFDTTEIEKSYKAFCKAVATITAEDDDEEEFDPIEAFKESEAEYWQNKANKIMTAAAKACLIKSISPKPVKVVGPEFGIEAQIALAASNIKRALEKLQSCDNDTIIIMLPGDEALSLKRFKGTRENGYQINHFYVEVAYKANHKIGSWFTVNHWLQNHENKPISELAKMDF